MDKDLFGEVIHPAKDPALKIGRKTERRREGLRLNHPQNTNPNGPKGKTCGDCRLCYGQRNYRQTIFYKCGFVDATNSSYTDIRLKWEACERFEEAWHLFDQYRKENNECLEGFTFTPIYHGFRVRHQGRVGTFYGTENEAICQLRSLIAKIKARKNGK